jgi:hypothetical protein
VRRHRRVERHHHATDRWRQRTPRPHTHIAYDREFPSIWLVDMQGTVFEHQLGRDVRQRGVDGLVFADFDPEELTDQRCGRPNRLVEFAFERGARRETHHRGRSDQQHEQRGDIHDGESQPDSRRVRFASPRHSPFRAASIR